MTESGHPGSPGAIQQGPERVKSSQTGPEQGQIRSISGPMRLKDPGSRVPGYIQHYPGTIWHWLQLPGRNGRAPSNTVVTTVPWVLPARKETGPLSPGSGSRSWR